MAQKNEDGLNRCYGFPEWVKTDGPNVWYLGPDIQCDRQELSGITIPADALATWEDGLYIFILRKIKDRPAHDNSLPEARLAHSKRSWKSTYFLGDAAFCRVETKKDSMGHREHELVAYVKEIEPQIPVPQTIHAWEDDELFWHISKRIPGETLHTAWPALTDTQRYDIAEEVAKHADALAQHTSLTIQGGLGAPPKRLTILFVEPQIMDSEDAKAHFSPIPDSEAPFILSHGELSPTNLIIRDGRLAGIIDWETLRYEPRFWLTTVMSATYQYSFDPPLYERVRENNGWGFLLSASLIKRGYPAHNETWKDWFKKKSAVEVQ